MHSINEHEAALVFPVEWDRERFLRHLAAPCREWARDLTSQGLKFSVQSRAAEWARDITGEPVDTPSHTAVWLVLALAGLHKVGEPDNKISLGDYLAGQREHHDHKHYRTIVAYAPGAEPDRTVGAVVAALRGGPASQAGYPDPLLLATDLRNQFSANAETRRRVATRWARAIAQAALPRT